VAIIQQRDPQVAKRVLTDWLRQHMPDADNLAVHVVGASEASGFSSDTIMFDATWDAGGVAERKAFVVRAAPIGAAVFRTYEIDLQFTLLTALADSSVPVPRTYWLEQDAAVLGAPFFAMERLDGAVPTDNPPYTLGGFLHDAPPDAQRTAWFDGIDALTDIAAFDWRAAGLGRLDRVQYGSTPGRQLMAWQREYYEWAARRPVPCVDHAWRWLEANQPDDDHLATLCWGDARRGNLLFDDRCRVQAVLDWEMARIGNPEFDLAWYLWFDRHFSEGIGVPRLGGFPSAAESIARWEDRMGRPAQHLEWYTVFTMVFFAGIMMRVIQSNIAHGASVDDFGPLETNNPCTQLLAQHFGLPAPE
jgi:aminoglycoside phosphotransferase (APT) family kinase protein